MKQVFDISAKLVSEQDEIPGVETIGWVKLFMDVLVFELSIFNARRSTSFRILNFALVRYTRTPIKHCMGRKIGVVQNISRIQKFGQN